MLLEAILTALLTGTPESFVLLEPATTLLPPLGITTDAGTRRNAYCEAGQATIAARFVADEGELIEVETLGKAADEGLHCEGHPRR